MDNIQQLAKKTLNAVSNSTKILLSQILVMKNMQANTLNAKTNYMLVI